MKFNSRIPVIALPYSEKHKAVPKELLIDYETGHIYVVSADDKSKIFDVTSKIIEKIESVTGDKIIVDIEGIGEVNLTEFLEQIKLDLDDMVIITEEGKDAYIPKPERFDGKSIESKYKNIQIKGFESAENGMVPQKYNGSVRWVFPIQGAYDSEDGTPPGKPNPDDGLDTRVILIEPVEGKLFLRASRRLKTENLQKDIRVILPRVLDQYTEIYWQLVTFSYTPILKFDDNIYFNEDELPIANGFNIYKFATWDGGETWFGSVEKYAKKPKKKRR